MGVIACTNCQLKEGTGGDNWLLCQYAGHHLSLSYRDGFLSDHTCSEPCKSDVTEGDQQEAAESRSYQNDRSDWDPTPFARAFASWTCIWEKQDRKGGEVIHGRRIDPRVFFSLDVINRTDVVCALPVFIWLVHEADTRILQLHIGTLVIFQDCDWSKLVYLHELGYELQFNSIVESVSL